MIDSEEGGITTVFVCNRTCCNRYFYWEYFRIKTVGEDGFVVVQNHKKLFEVIFRWWNNNNQTILPSYSKYFLLLFKEEC